VKFAELVQKNAVLLFAFVVRTRVGSKISTAFLVSAEGEGKKLASSHFAQRTESYHAVIHAFVSQILV
jgi:hypothetical protein